MDYINKLVLAHVLATPAVAAALGALAGNVDRLIKFSLQYFSVDQEEKAVDAAAAALKARIDLDAKK